MISLNNFDFFASIIDISVKDLPLIFNKFYFLILLEFCLAGIMPIIIFIFDINDNEFIYNYFTNTKYMMKKKIPVFMIGAGRIGFKLEFDKKSKASFTLWNVDSR